MGEIRCKPHKILTFPWSLVLDIANIDLGEECGGKGGKDPKEDDVTDEPPHWAGRKRRSEGCRREAGEQLLHHGW
jgi:hypothetical protein